MKIGANLEKFRNLNGYSRTDVIEKLGIGRSTLGGWETDVREPSFDMLDNLAKLYNTTVSSFFEVNNDDMVIQNDDNKIDFLDRIVIELNQEGCFEKGVLLDTLDDSSKQILLGALEKHIQKIIEKPV